jgi:hypothetical protein
MKAMTREIDAYLRLRRGMGFKLEVDEAHLRRFAVFLAEERPNGVSNGLSGELKLRMF